MRDHNIWYHQDGTDEGSQHNYGLIEMVQMRVTTYGLVEMVQMRGHKILSHRDSSYEGSQHMILWRTNKSYP